jgi:coat protein Gp5
VANTLLTNSIVTLATLDVLENTYNVWKKCNNEYDDQFTFGGAVLGQTLNIRKPARYVGRLGQATNVEAITEQYVPLTLAYQRGVDTQVSSQQLKLEINEYKTRVIKPKIARISNLVDQDVCGLAQGFNNFVGTPGTTPSQLATFLAAKVKLDNMAAPMDDQRFFALNPAAEAAIVDSLKGLFNATSNIAEQYRTGEMGHSIGARWMMDQNIYVQTVGALGASTPVVGTAPANGATTISTTGWTTGTANAGDVFSIVSSTVPVNGVNPQSYQSTGQPMQFVVTATTSDSGGTMVIPFAPAMIYSGQLQNITNQPAVSSALYWYDTAAASLSGIVSKQSPQNLYFHKDAMTVACVDMPLPGGTDVANRAASRRAGTSIRVIRDYQVTTDQWIERTDLLYGVAVLRQELGCRIGG